MDKYIVYLDDKIIHSPYYRQVKISSGVITQRQITHSFKFQVNQKNPAWRGLKPFRSIIRVVNHKNGEEVFHGRAIVPLQSMDASGDLRTTYVAEDRSAYLNDTIQTNYYHRGNDVKSFLAHIINVHNTMLPRSPQKHFKVGNVTVTDPNSDMKKYINDGDKTLDVIKKQLIDLLGGNLILRQEDDGLYIDYLETVGRRTTTRIMPRRNLKAMSREIDPSAVISIIVPYGAELELPDDATDESIEEMGTKRVNIASVNGGKIGLDDEGLIEEFGEIQREVIFEDVEDPQMLLEKGLVFKDSQDAAMVNFKITPLDLSQKEGEDYVNFEAIELYNWYEIYNPMFDIYEVLQVVEREIDILNVSKCNVVVGSKALKLSDYQKMMKKSTMKIEDRLTYTDRRQRLANRKLKKVTDDLTTVTGELSEVQGEMLTVQGTLVDFRTDLMGAIGDINKLTTGLSNVETMYQEMYSTNSSLKPRSDYVWTDVYGPGGLKSRIVALEARL